MRQEESEAQGPLLPEAEVEESASLLNDKTFVRRCIEVYFDSATATTCVFLLKPQILADWTSGKLDPILLKVLVAAGLRTRRDIPKAAATAAAWMQQAQQYIVGRTGSLSLTRVQILVLLLRFHTVAGSLLEAWELISLAARVAFTMRLNWEDPGLDPAAQESRRRLIWTIFLTDRHLCGGVEELAVCPQEMMHVRLPCDDHTFRRVIASQAEFLGDRPVPENAGHMDILAYYIRLSAARHRILVYTKRVRRLNESPVTSRDEYNTLQQELDSVQATLPDDFRLGTENTRVMVHSPDASGYLALHTLWLQCYCDLNRFFIPGLRESVSAEAMAQTPPEIIEHCQRACLSSAVRLCDFWSEVRALEPATSTDDMFLAISIYQVTQILQHARHMLATDGPHSLESLRGALLGALQLASCLRTTFPRASDCLTDARHLVTMLGQEDAQSRSSSADERGEGHHLPSRHSLLLEVTRRSGDGQGQRPRHATRATSDVPSSTSANSAWISDSHSPALSWQQGDAGITRLHPPGSVSFMVEAQPAQSEGQDASLYLLEDGSQGFPSRGPFDMEMNDYYDPELGQLLLSMSTEPWT